MLPHVFHVDNGIIHQRTDGNGHTSQTHGIDTQPHVVQHQNGHHQGKRKGNQRNNRRPRIGQEQEEHDDHKDGTFIQRFLYVADGAFNEARLAEHIGRDFHILRQVLLQIGQGLLQLFRQGNRTRIGLLRYRKQYGWLSFFGSHSQLGLLRTDTHIGHIFQGNGCSLCRAPDDGPSQLMHIVRRKHSPHNVLVAIFIDDPSIGILVHVARYGHHLSKSHPIMTHPVGMNQNLVFLDVSPQYGHLCHTSGGQQTRTDGPVGQRTQILHGSRISGQAHNQQFAQDRRLRSQRGLPHIVRQRLAHCGQLLRHNLTGQIDIGIPFKLDPNH